MKICAAQTRPVKGDIQINIEHHKRFINLAVNDGADIIIFPELSLTGYEPTLAKELATEENNSRFDAFQKISDAGNIIIGAGVPLESIDGPVISMLVFQPNLPKQVYAKQHLHADEYPYFVNGKEQVYLSSNQHTIALAICYELSVPEHAANVHANGADMYIASVAKTAGGVDKAFASLREIAKKYAMFVVMSNCIGICDGVECGGRTAAWNNKGELIGQLDSINEGTLLIDTDTLQITERTM